MFSKVSTHGYVLGSYDRGEADKRIKILTRDYGVVHMLATSIRKEKSKMRFVMQTYNLVEIELVDSKSGWRLTGAGLLFDSKSEMKEGEYVVFAKACALIDRLVYGEDHDPGLFAVMERYLRYIRDNEIPENLLQVFELHWVAALLLELGYLNIDQLDLSIGLPLQELSINSLENLLGEEMQLSNQLNLVLQETQL